MYVVSSVIHEDTKQSNASSISQFMWYLLQMLGLHYCVHKGNSDKKKTGEKQLNQ